MKRTCVSWSQLATGTKRRKNQQDSSVDHFAELKSLQSIGHWKTGRPSRRDSIYYQDRPYGHEQAWVQESSQLMRLAEATLHHIMVLGCTAAQRQLIGDCHEWLCAHNGVDYTLTILAQYQPRHGGKSMVESATRQGIRA